MVKLREEELNNTDKIKLRFIHEAFEKSKNKIPFRAS